MQNASTYILTIKQPFRVINKENFVEFDTHQGPVVLPLPFDF